MKKRKLKKSVIKLLWLTIAAMVVIILNLVVSKEDPDTTKLKEMFTKDEIKQIKSKDNTQLVLKLMSMDNFEKENLDRYIAFINKNVPQEAVIKLVNNDIDKISGFKYNDIILSLLDEQYYIYKNTNRYMNYYEKNTKSTSKEIVTVVNTNIDRPFYTDTTKTDLSKGNLILVNKYTYLEEDYVPTMVEIKGIYHSPYNSATQYLTADAYEAFKEMVDAAKKDGITLFAASPYRSYSKQSELYNRYGKADGYDKADTYSARPGSSEHQTGLAVDINAADDWFNNTKEAKWLANNAYKYGFILRYPKGKEYITGYQYESWHYRYVGKEAAKYIYENDITFEEYYAYFLDK